MRIGHGSLPSNAAALLIAGATLALSGGTRLSGQEDASKKDAQANTAKSTALDQTSTTQTHPQLHVDILLLEVPAKLHHHILPHDTEKFSVVAASAQSPTFPLRGPVVLSDDQHERVIKWTAPKSKAGVKILDRRSITMRSGEHATIHMDDQVPVVVGPPDRKTRQLRIVQRAIGFRYKIRATLSDDKQTVNMDCSFSHGAIDTKRKQPVVTVNGVATQQPSITYRSGGYGIDVPTRSAVACVGGREQRDGSEVAQVFVVTVSRALAASPAS